MELDDYGDPDFGEQLYTANIVVYEDQDSVNSQELTEPIDEGDDLAIEQLGIEPAFN